ncbi:amino acid transporter [Pedobacter sp. UYP24]
MRYLILLILICLNGYLLFFASKKYERPFLLKAFPALIPVIIILFLGLGLVVKLLHIPMKYVTSERLISAMMSLIVISMINFANQFSFYMVDAIINFHQKNNAANVGRQPIKFFIDHQIRLKQFATVIWFLGSALMLYGIWLGDPLTTA